MANPRGPRLNKRQTDSCRAKIQTTQLVNRLQKHIKGEVTLDATQISAIKLLLDKSLPSLQAVDSTVTQNQTPIDPKEIETLIEHELQQRLRTMDSEALTALLADKQLETTEVQGHA